MINAELASLLERSIAGNTVQGWLTALLIFLGALAALYVVRGVLFSHLRKLAEKTETDLDDFLIDLVYKVRQSELLLFAFYLATRCLSLSAGLDKVIHLVFVLVFSYRAVTLLQAAMTYGLNKAVGTSQKDAGAHSAMQVLHVVLNIVVWAGAIVFILGNLGINISTVVAGLGIGGVAVALAAQQILGDLFSCFAIFMDKPFRLGDFIQLGSVSGTVERVGIKTTRVRSLDGELLIIPNKELTSGILRNYRELKKRRVVLNFSLAHGTPHAKAAAVPALLKEVISAAPKTQFARAHLCGVGEDGIRCEAVYLIDGADYDLFMDAQQKVTLGLLERFSAEGLRFGVPTRTVVTRNE
jgi:small-conductance mechanosensitive channel